MATIHQLSLWDLIPASPTLDLDKEVAWTASLLPVPCFVFVCLMMADRALDHELHESSARPTSFFSVYPSSNHRISHS